MQSLFCLHLSGEERKMHRKMSMHQMLGADTAILTFYSSLCVPLHLQEMDLWLHNTHWCPGIWLVLLQAHWAASSTWAFSLTRRSLLETRWAKIACKWCFCGPLSSSEWEKSRTDVCRLVPIDRYLQTVTNRLRRHKQKQCIQASVKRCSLCISTAL